MNIIEWLKEVEETPICRIRKMQISNEEWDKICERYEDWCKKNCKYPEY